jgi:hypothetical protein
MASRRAAPTVDTIAASDGGVAGTAATVAVGGVDRAATSRVAIAMIRAAAGTTRRAHGAVATDHATAGFTIEVVTIPEGGARGPFRDPGADAPGVPPQPGTPATPAAPDAP